MPEQLRTRPPELDEVPPGYHGALDGARAAVLSRLVGALHREPVPGVDRTRLSGTGDLFADPVATVTLDGRPYDDPATLLRDLAHAGAVDRLAAELDNSVHNLALARAAQPRPHHGRATLATIGPDLPAAEQLVVDGHPIHPCCRTRLGMSTADVLAYAPEHHPVVDLVEVAVPAERWLSTGEGLPPRLLLHPWQAGRAREAYPWLVPTGRRVSARPLMSLRTLALVDDPLTHVKTAVDVQMTSAVRTVSPAAVHNGPLVSALLVALTATMPALTVLRERAAGTVLVDGAAQRSLSHVLRDAPTLGPGETAVPLAALSAPSPTDGRPLVTEAITQGYAGRGAGFLADLVDLAAPPLFALLRAGVALEAHGQNTLVVLRDGRPVRLLYRDVGGVRISPAALARTGVPAPDLRGDLATDDPDVLRTKLVAAFVTTVLGELVAVLAREYPRDGPLWPVVAAGLRAAGAPPEVYRDPLPVKAMTTMRLADDPLDDVWTSVPNPMEAW